MKNKVTFVMRFSIITNIFLSIIKIITGIFFSSGALISDGIHSLSDLITDLVAVIGGWLAQKPADYEHPYGHGKIEYLTSLIIGVIIIIVGGEVIYNSINNEIIIPSFIVVIVSFVSIILKLLLSNYIIKQGKLMNNNILISSGKESKMDVISSLVVLISAILMQFGSNNNILQYSDIVASIIVGIFIIRTGFIIIKENVNVVLGAQETDEKYLNNIREIIKSNSEVLEIDSLVIMKYGHKSSLTLTILMDGNTTISDAHDIADTIEEQIKKENEKIEFISIHIEPKVNVDN